jgi:hypothetical protein
MIANRTKITNSYLLAYLDKHGIKNGDEVKFHEYSSWISQKHEAFRKIKKCGYYNGFPPEVKTEFIEFIRG